MANEWKLLENTRGSLGRILKQLGLSKTELNDSDV